MRALRFDGSLRLVRNVPEPMQTGETLVQVLYAGICNTDLEIVKGYGGFRGTLGHEFVGRVVESPEAKMVGKRVCGEINAGCGACDLCRSGDSRHCPSRTVLGIRGRDGAFADFLTLPAGNLVEVPGSISDQQAVFIEPLAAAASILEQACLTSTTRVVLVGDGKLAQLIAQVVRLSGCALTVIGKHSEKLDRLAGIGVHRILLPAIGDGVIDPQRWLADHELSHAFDVVIEASGSAKGLELALGLARPRGTIVLKSTYYGTAASDLSAVVVNELRIVGSRCGRFGPAINLLSKGAVDVRRLISAEYSIENGLAAFAEAALPSTMKVLLRFDLP